MSKPVITYKSSNYVTTAGPTFTASPTWTPAANSLLVALVVGCSASPTDPTGVTGHGQTYSKVTVPTATLSTTHIMSIWVANAGASPSSVAEVASFGGTPTGDALICFEITGWESAEQAINAFGFNINTGTGTGTTGTVTIGLRPDVTSEHVNLSFFLHLANEATTFRTNWTETAGADGNFNSPATGAEAQFRTDVFELTSTATWTTSALWRGLALVVRSTASTPRENVKVTEQLTVSLTPIFTSPSENVKVSDAVTAGIPLSAPLLTENILVDDIGQGATQLFAPIRVQDVLTVERVDIAGDPTASKTEALLASDTVATTLNPEQASKTETVLVSDAAAVTLNPEQAQPTETVLVSDSVSATLNPLLTSLQENVLVTDTATGNMALQASKTEAVLVSDTVTTRLNPLQATPGEAVLVSDTASTTLNPLRASLQENVLPSDAVVATADLRASLTNEQVKVSDTVTATMALAPPVLSESVLVSDSVQAQRIGDLTVSETEAVLVSENVTAQVTLLLVTLIESVTLGESANVILGVGVSVHETIRVVDVVQGLLNPLETSLVESVLVQDQWRSVSGRVRVRDVQCVTAAAINVSVVANSATAVSVVAATVRNVEVE